MLEIRKVLVLSTSHVTEATARMLNRLPAAEWPVTGGHYGSYGWFLYCGINESTPADLAVLFEFAVNKGCHHILLDQDADFVDELEIFEW